MPESELKTGDTLLKFPGSSNGHKTPMQLLEEGGVKMCAPMVRYSKLPFRLLVRRYGCDLAFTPMIVANPFVQSSKARDSEFTTNSDDRPLVVQFAANNAEDFSAATELVAPFCDGVDLNCGCPQRWAIQEGFGASLLDKPELVRDIVRQTRNRLPMAEEEFAISIKIRLHKDLKRSVELCRQAEKAGVSWIAVHGRTKDQQKDPVQLEAVKTLVQAVNCPVVANGDIRSLEECDRIKEVTGAKGYMCARGILQNPAVFSGFQRTPRECIQDWLDISLGVGTHFTAFHHHLIYMSEQILPRADRRVFNMLNGTASVLAYLSDNFDIRPAARSGE